VGAEDLLVSLGGSSSRFDSGTTATTPALPGRTSFSVPEPTIGWRSTPFTSISRRRRLHVEAHDAASSGFSATACIHPSQVNVIRGAYRPTDDEIAWASGVIRAATNERGAFRYDGRMVDAPLLRHAEQILAKSGRLEDERQR